MAGRALEGRGAIVTGASAGIGKEIARALAAEGAFVIVNYSNNADGAQQTVDAINKDGEKKAHAVKADVSNEGDVRRLLEEAEAAFGGPGKLHILVNNAGVGGTISTVADTSVDCWDRIFAVNCRGTFLCSQEGARRIVRGGGGRIINITSSLVASLRVGHGAYGASKAAVETMTKIMAKELRGTLITANCVAPGPVATDLFFAGRSQDMIDRVVADCPLERLGKVEDVAPTVVFLASDKGEWVNAQVVRVNGGYVS